MRKRVKIYRQSGYCYRIGGSKELVNKEYLVSRLLEYTTLHKDTYISYKLSKIYGTDACKYKEYTQKENKFISLVEMYGGKEQDLISLLAPKTPQERIDLICGMYANTNIKIPKLRTYLHTLMQLDTLTLAERDLSSIGIMFNQITNKAQIAPILVDNPLCLNSTDRVTLQYKELGMGMGMGSGIGIGIGKPMFKINYKGFYKELKTIQKTLDITKEDSNTISLLESQLERYKKVFSI